MLRCVYDKYCVCTTNIACVLQILRVYTTNIACASTTNIACVRQILRVPIRHDPTFSKTKENSEVIVKFVPRSLNIFNVSTRLKDMFIQTIGGNQKEYFKTI